MMKLELPEYVTSEEVKRVCKELNIRDWSILTEPEVLPEEAATILMALDVENMDISPDNFRQGVEVELEHGTMFGDANVTNNHPILTGKIVIAHLKESLDYYKRLEIAELEGDLFKAAAAEDSAKIETLYRKLICARHALCQEEAEGL